MLYGHSASDSASSFPRALITRAVTRALECWAALGPEGALEVIKSKTQDGFLAHLKVCFKAISTETDKQKLRLVIEDTIRNATVGLSTVRPEFNDEGERD